MAISEDDVYRFGAAAKKKIMEQMTAAGKPSKYRNVKSNVAGITFDSKKEAGRFEVLQILQAIGSISDLRLQHRITIVEGYTKPSGERVRPLVYIADFSYIPYGQNERVYEDVKGKRTQEYINKRKMVYEMKGIEIQEV